MTIPSTSRVIGRDPDEDADVSQLIDDIVPDAETWKQTPNAGLGGKKPIDVINTPQEQALRDMLRAAKHGMMS